MREYWKLKDEALDHTLWRTRLGRGHGPAVRQITEWMKYLNCMDFIWVLGTVQLILILQTTVESTVHSERCSTPQH